MPFEDTRSRHDFRPRARESSFPVCLPEEFLREHPIDCAPTENYDGRHFEEKVTCGLLEETTRANVDLFFHRYP